MGAAASETGAENPNARFQFELLTENAQKLFVSAVALLTPRAPFHDVAPLSRYNAQRALLSPRVRSLHSAPRALQRAFRNARAPDMSPVPPVPPTPPAVTWTQSPACAWPKYCASTRMRQLHVQISRELLRLYLHLVQSKFLSSEGIVEEAKECLKASEQDPLNVLYSAIRITRSWLDTWYLQAHEFLDFANSEQSAQSSAPTLHESLRLRAAVALTLAYKLHSECDFGNWTRLRHEFWPQCSFDGLNSPRFRAPSVTMSMSLLARFALCKTSFHWPLHSDVAFQKQLIDYEVELVTAPFTDLWKDCNANVQELAELELFDAQHDLPLVAKLCVRALLPFFTIGATLSPLDNGFSIEKLEQLYTKTVVSRGLVYLCAHLVCVTCATIELPELKRALSMLATRLSTREGILCAARICEAAAVYHPPPKPSPTPAQWGLRTGVYARNGTVVVERKWVFETGRAVRVETLQAMLVTLLGGLRSTVEHVQ